MRRMKTVGMYEARTHFARLLDRVEAGETIIIARHGVPVARLVPVREVSARQADAAVNQLRELRRGVRLDGLNIRDLIEEGRR